MADSESRAAKLALVGGALCLDFTNTVSDHASANPSEHLENYADLLAWSKRAGILSNRAAQQLGDEATNRPKQAAQVYQRAVALRESIYRILTVRVENKSYKPADLAALNDELANALAHLRIESTKDGFQWEWTKEIELDRMLWSIARSAADLLTSGNIDKVRQCNGDDCGWLFIDTSKNHSRRWCAMNDCGNRAKARRHYARMRATKKS